MQLYDTMSGEVRPLRPLTPGRIGIYVCGLTTYDHCHIGHARTFLTFDVLVRHLRATGLEVRYVRNITDVDDRIIERALANSEQASALVERMVAGMHGDFAALGLKEPDLEPRATESVADIVAMTETLIAAGLAYATDAGNVWYRVNAFVDYGRLSRREKSSAIQSRQEAEAVQDKEDVRDFALWKAADADDRAVGTVWDSPWGPGRPGWHIECSAMSVRHLGEEFELHGGGLDLLFPHHENEVAQSVGAGCAFARHWMHVAPLRMGREKMSKSLGNVMSIPDALRRWPAEAVRHAMLSSHYRSPLEFRADRVDASRGILDRWYGAVEAGQGDLPDHVPADTGFRADFEAAMDTDLNLPEALRALSGLAREINRRAERSAAVGSQVAELVAMANRLGLLQASPADWFQRKSGSDADIEARVLERQRARERGDYAAADRIRQALLDRGVELLDDKGKTRWRWHHRD